MFINPTRVSAATEPPDDGSVAAETRVGFMNIPRK
jgi:hypothetical protein